jgi:hypothetical protein
VETPAPEAPDEFWHVDLERLEVDFDLEFDGHRVKDRTRRGHETYVDEDLRLQEAIGLGLRGDVHSPEILEWTADLRFGLDQGRFTQDYPASDGTDSDHGTLLDYDISLQLLRARPASASAFARRFDSRIPRPFLPSLREEQSEAGGSVFIAARPLTLELGVIWREIDRTGNVRRIDDESQRSALFYTDSRWEWDRHSLSLRYEFEDEDIQYQGSSFDNDTRRHELRMEHSLLFGPDEAHRWDTFLRYTDESGDLARDEVNVNTRMTLKHSERFRTIQRYSYYRYEQGITDVDQHRLDLTAELQLPMDFRLTGNLFGAYERQDHDVDSDQFGGDVDLTWHRRVAGGELWANLNFGYAREEVHGDAGRRFVRNEALQFGVARRPYLLRSSVIPGTIFAHSLDYSRVYLSGTDYVPLIAGDLVLISRLPGGRIQDGEVVYFDYHYEVPAEASLSNFRCAVLLEQRFDSGWTPYYSYEGRFQDIDQTSTGTPWRADNLDRQRLGLRIESPAWGASAEGEYFDDDIDPYHALHFIGRATVLDDVDHQLNLRAELSPYWFRGDDLDHRRVWWFDIELQDRLRFGDRWSMNGTLGYRWEDDSVDGTTHGVDAEWLLSYTRNFLNVELALEYDLLSIADDRDDSYGLFLRIRRDLSHLLPPAEKWR